MTDALSTWFACFADPAPVPITTSDPDGPPWHDVHVELPFHASVVTGAPYGAVLDVPFEWQYVDEQV